MNKAPLLTPRLEQAMSMAIRVHGSMKRKGDGQPYLVHPISVLALLVRWEANEDTCIAGLLHDVIEDAESDELRAEYRKEIAATFGEKVLEIVEGVTEQDKSLPWQIRKERYLEHLQIASKQSLLISCADRIHNTSSLLLAYKHDGEAIWGRFKAGKEEQIWFATSVMHILEERLGTSYTEELAFAIKEIEGKKHDRKSAATEGSPRVPATQFHYLFDDWRNAKLTCPVCGWKGKLEYKCTEAYDSLFDYSCPKCDKMLAIVSYPTQEEEDVWGKTTPGDAVAQYRVGLQFFYGRGVEKDMSTAIKLLMRAAEQQFPSAQFHLGAIYYGQYFNEFFGVDIAQYVPHDSMIALDLFQRAACNGHGMAQMMLAEWYEEGIVVQRNEILGKIWHDIANIFGQYSPVKNGDLLPKTPTQAEVIEYQATQQSQIKQNQQPQKPLTPKGRQILLSIQEYVKRLQSEK